MRQIPSTLYGTNVEWAWDAYSLWNPQTASLDPTLVKLTSAMGVTLIRYPGGMYADFYHWSDGVGPVAARPVVQLQAGSTDTDRIDFGTDEALSFAKTVNGELLITVNAGTGTAQEAADWVRYVNANGLKVRYWEIGNELYINDGSTAQTAITIDPATYAARFLQFAQAMRAADSRIKIGAIGGQNQGVYDFVAYPNWNQIVLQQAGSQIDFLAVHNSYAPVNVNDTDGFRNVYSALYAASALIRQNLQTLSSQIAAYAPARASQIAIAVTEWGPLFQLTTAGRYVEHTKTLGSALFAASTMKAFLESPQTQIANFHVLNDMSIMCWICSTNGNFPPQPVWTPTARYLAFQLFRQHFGTQLVSSTVSSPTFNSPAIGTMSAVANNPYLEVVSSLSADAKTLYVVAINRHFDSPINTTIHLSGFQPNLTAQVWTLDGTGTDANTGTVPLQLPGQFWTAQTQDPSNPQFDNGGPGQVTVAPSTFSGVRSAFTYTFPPHSVTALQINKQGAISAAVSRYPSAAM